MKKSLTNLQIYARERERENTPTNLFKKSIFRHKWLRGKLMSNLYVKPWYPVGAILEFDRPMDMTAIYGGTWELFGAGRMTVSIDTNDVDFNSAGKKGGSKEMQEHNHEGYCDQAVVLADTLRVCAGNYSGEGLLYPNHAPATPNSGVTTTDLPAGSNVPGGNHGHRLIIDNAGKGNSGNMSPYIVVYRYRKVAN